MTLIPTLSRGRGSQNPVPLLLREKGLGDEGLQLNYAYLLTIKTLNTEFWQGITIDQLRTRQSITPIIGLAFP